MHMDEDPLCIGCSNFQACRKCGQLTLRGASRGGTQTSSQLCVCSSWGVVPRQMLPTELVCVCIMPEVGVHNHKRSYERFGQGVRFHVNVWYHPQHVFIDE
jgi:hypothetical protein